MKRKFIIFLTIMLLVVCMATSAFAATPKLKTPKMPKIPEIKVSVTLPDSVFDDWFKEHPFTFK